MENMRYPIKLDMNDTGALKTSIRLKQGDSAITLILRIYKDGVNVFSVDDIPSIVFHRPDGTSVIGECLTSEGQYTYQFAGNELQYSGQIRADVKFDLYTVRESTVTFLFECVTDTIPSNVTGAGIYVNSLKDIKDYLDGTVTKIEQELEAFDIQTVLDAVNRVEEVEGRVEQIAADIPDIPEITPTATTGIEVGTVKVGNETKKLYTSHVAEPWTSKSWPAGSYVTDDGKLWKCNVTNSSKPTAGANWTEIVIGNEITALNENMTHKVEIIKSEKVLSGNYSFELVAGHTYFVIYRNNAIASTNKLTSICVIPFFSNSSYEMLELGTKANISLAINDGVLNTSITSGGVLSIIQI